MPSAEEFRVDLQEALDGDASPQIKADKLLTAMTRLLTECPGSADDISIAADWAWSEKVLPLKPHGFAPIEHEGAHDKQFEVIEAYFDSLAGRQNGMGS